VAAMDRRQRTATNRAHRVGTVQGAQLMSSERLNERVMCGDCLRPDCKGCER